MMCRHYKKVVKLYFSNKFCRNSEHFSTETSPNAYLVMKRKTPLISNNFVIDKLQIKPYLSKAPEY
jgi:hypothetical protein